MIYAVIVFDGDMVQLTSEELATRIQAFAYNLERLLGASSGSLIDVIQRVINRR